jgi:hypothetical protein
MGALRRPPLGLNPASSSPCTLTYARADPSFPRVRLRGWPAAPRGWSRLRIAIAQRFESSSPLSASYGVSLHAKRYEGCEGSDRSVPTKGTGNRARRPTEAGGAIASTSSTTRKTRRWGCNTSGCAISDCSMQDLSYLVFYRPGFARACLSILRWLRAHPERRRVTGRRAWAVGVALRTVGPPVRMVPRPPCPLR